MHPIGNEFFPLNDQELHQRLLDQFYNLWGEGILWLISKVAPYAAHLQALRGRYHAWNVADNIQTLARDALCEGVGMFWTLQDGHKLWEDQCEEANKQKKKKPQQPDVSKAWQVLNGDQRDLFYKRRSALYLGSEEERDQEDSDSLFKGLRTYAAQVGLIMAWVTLQQKTFPDGNPVALAKALTQAINKTLETGPNAQRDRKLILLKSSTRDGFKPLNMLPRLDPTLAGQFRYLWLELALSEQGRDALNELDIDMEEALSVLEESRREYLKVVIANRRKMRLKDADLRDKPQAEQNRLATERAREDVMEDQAQAHKYWFGGHIDQCRQLISETLGEGAKSVSEVPMVVNDEDEDDETEEDDDIQL